MKKFIVLLVLLVILVGCGPIPAEQPALVSDQDPATTQDSHVKVKILTTYIGASSRTIIRTIDLEAGVVCYDAGEWGKCFLLDETRLDY